MDDYFPYSVLDFLGLTVVALMCYSAGRTLPLFLLAFPAVRQPTGSAAGVVVIVLPVIAGVVVLATAILVVVVIVFIVWRRGAEVAYITSEKDYEMSPPGSSADLEKSKFGDVSFEPSTKFSSEKH